MVRFLLLFSFVLTLVGCSGKQSSDSLVDEIPTPPSTIVAAPSSVTLIDPLTTPANNPTPTIQVGGVEAGFTVSLYIDSACSTLLASSIATGASVDFTTAALTDGVYEFYANATDTDANVSACSTAKADYTLITQAPMISGVSDDLVARQTKSWAWSCSTSCTYRFIIDQNPTTTPTGAYSAASSAEQLTGDATFYLHLQAIDALGNESAVVHVSALLDNTAPATPSSLTLQTPVSTPSNVTTPMIRVSGVADQDRVTLYTDSLCTLSVGMAISGGVSVDVTTNILSTGTYNFYARSSDEAGNLSSCSTNFVVYELDATPPQVVSILAPANGAYSIGSSLDFQFSFSEVITVTGTPCVEMATTTQTRAVCYTSGSGTNALSFSYTVQAGDDDPDGISLTSTINLFGGSIVDSVSNAALLNFSSVAPDLSSVTIDTGFMAPNAVTALTQTNLTSDRMNVSFIWSAPNGNGNPITKYIIRYRKENASQFSFLTPDPTAASATITGLDVDSVYEIQVAAFNGVIGPYSPVLKVSTFYNPKSLGALVWYEAKDINADGVGVSDGVAITVLRDKSGNNNHATKISGTSATIQTVDGYKVLRLDLAGYRTNASLGESNNTQVEVYIVARTRQVTNSYAFVNENQNNLTTRFGTHFPWSDNNAYIDLPLGNRVSGNWGGNTAEFFAWTFRSSTTAGIALERNGVPLLSGPNRANTPPLKRWTIGANYVGSGSFWKADLQAFFVFDKVLDTTQRAEFFQFIQDEYGVLMP